MIQFPWEPPSFPGLREGDVGQGRRGGCGALRSPGDRADWGQRWVWTAAPSCGSSPPLGGETVSGLQGTWRQSPAQGHIVGRPGGQDVHSLPQICLRTSSCSWRAPLGLLGQVTLHSERRRSAKVTQPGQAGPPHPLAGDNLAQLRVPSTCLAPHTLMTMESSSAEGQVLGMPSPRVPSKVLSGYRSGQPGAWPQQLLRKALPVPLGTEWAGGGASA